MAHPTMLIGPCFTLALEKPGPLVPVRKSPATFRGWIAAPGDHHIETVELQFGPQSFVAPFKRRGDVRRAHPGAATTGFEVRIPVANVTSESVIFAVTIDGQTYFVSTHLHVAKDATFRARST